MRGDVGEVVNAEVGVRNLGPARVDGSDTRVTFDVVIPAGVEVVSTADSCSLVSGRGYRCYLYQEDIEVGASLTVPFELRVTSARRSTGSVTVATTLWGEPGPDRDRSNNTAPIVVNGRR